MTATALCHGTRRGRSGLIRTERRWGIVLALPAVLGFVIFTIGPMIASFFFSLTEWVIGAPPAFVGIGNYQSWPGTTCSGSRSASPATTPWPRSRW
ncbi:hypothetical protein [Microlunatus speluncae]|uniref:hypothetical protein n=1 Tax=Microlunatus speluncae TaxID=2594267 RepID=UPI001FE4A6E1|nr:hypothetical protein [Microlunatus speluncae]